MRQRTAWLYVALLGCLGSLAVIYRAQTYPAPPSLNRVAAWMPSTWDRERARASWDAHRRAIHELSPVWYSIAPAGDGSIIAYAGARDAALIAQAHAQSTLVIPLIHNAYDDIGVDPTPVSIMIHDPLRRAAHIAALMNEAEAYDYDGIDIDYESLGGPEDREAFSQFIEELAAALHTRGLLLSVTVHPKTAEPGTWEGAQAQDWARIGAAADRVRIMAYAYHWRTSDPGPIAPLWWVEEVTRFAVSVIPPNKVYLGIHFYGHDWSNASSESVTWESAQDRLAAYGATRQWQTSEGWLRPVAEPWFTYTDESGRQHRVWYADGESVAVRIALAQKYSLGGIAVWRLGGEDPAIWQAITEMLGPASP